MTVLNYGVAWTVLSFLYFYNSLHNHGFVHVKIDKGVLRGRIVSTWSGIKYSAFKGIPYAQPPIGSLRFKGPREEAPWKGIRDATEHGSVCPHVDMAYYVFRGKEDCLFLNVYTPSLDAERLPVMFYIHGGKFDISSGNDELWAPDYFVEAGVILVTINYRLGPLGFLTTEDDEAPGNAGLKDVVAALRWVQRNIESFGGDPNRVTIFGASTGSVSVQYLMLSPMASGLFAGGIGHSGSVLNSWVLSENGASHTIRLAVALGAKNVNGDKRKALDFLRTASPEQMAWIQEDIVTPLEKKFLYEFLFVPTVEKNVISEEVFLSDTPRNILKSGRYNDVPFMTGHTSHEGLLYLNAVLENPEIMKAASEDTERFVPRDIKNRRLRKELGRSIREFYFDDKPVGEKNVSNLVKLYGDVIFADAVKRAAKLQLRTSRSPIYFFVYSYDGNLNLIKFTLGLKTAGAAHGDELGYLFYQKLLFWRKPGIRSEDEYVHKTMIRLWTNFARYGNPTPPGDPITWKPASLNEFNYLNISGYDTRLGVNPDPARTKFWEIAYERNDALLRH